jgi:hypothetical protein
MEFKEPKPNTNLGVNERFPTSLYSLDSQYLRKAIKETSRILPKEVVILKDSTSVEISPVIWRSIAGPESSHKGKNEINIILIASQQNKKIEGFRTLSGIFDKSQKNLEVSGRIAVHQTGNGLGAAIDQITVKNLQSIANRYNIKITWTVQNQNLVRTQELEEQINGPDEREDLIPEYEQNLKEQAAWQKIYGEGGKMGFIFEGKHHADIMHDKEGIEVYKKVFLPEQGTDTSSLLILDPIFSEENIEKDPTIESFLRKTIELIHS